MSKSRKKTPTSHTTKLVIASARTIDVRFGITDEEGGKSNGGFGHVQSVTHLHVANTFFPGSRPRVPSEMRSAIADKLESLADTIRHSHDFLKGDAEIILVRR